jgi:hypothetical protein
MSSSRVKALSREGGALTLAWDLSFWPQLAAYCCNATAAAASASLITPRFSVYRDPRHLLIIRIGKKLVGQAPA